MAETNKVMGTVMYADKSMVYETAWGRLCGPCNDGKHEFCFSPRADCHCRCLRLDDDEPEPLPGDDSDWFDL